ncbi:Cut9-interacting protein scn1 [Ceratocystis fimbriata CBS 114723]|uniref:Cut9-interacting protein scn1 n=1 Tax=Ceratocystis fimbriata CBS 114723 TaxID=1035309 RepID=A0A2C5X941_9PEZI|nr:Cut9-interacting protein scn1 [Ceratocystis fimbriata CBS 114723]
MCSCDSNAAQAHEPGPQPTSAANSHPTPLPLPSITAGPLYDAHCHPTDNMHHIARISNMRTSKLIAMATRVQDQPLVASLAQSSPKVIPAFGWHPWFAHLLYDDGPDSVLSAVTGPGLKTAHYANVLSIAKPLSTQDAAFVTNLPDPIPLSTFLANTRQRLIDHPTALVGEIGLDRAFRLPEHPVSTSTPPSTDSAPTPGTRNGRRLSPYRVSIAHQILVLRAQLNLAAELQRAVSVHGVQAHGVLYDVLAQTWKGHEVEVPNRRRRRVLARGIAAQAEEAETSDEDEGEDGGGGQDPRDQKNPRLESPSSAHRLVTFPPRICLHSFSGTKDVAKQYLHPKIPSAIYFSFSAAVNLSGGPSTKSNPNTAMQKLEAVLSILPADRILAESDLDVAGEEMDAALANVYAAICKARDWEMEEGIAHIAQNFEAFIET